MTESGRQLQWPEIQKTTAWEESEEFKSMEDYDRK